MRQKKVKACNRCGMSNLYWALDGSSWRLADQSGKLHSCKDAKFNPIKIEYATPGKSDADPVPNPVQAEAQQSQGDQSDYKSESQGQEQGKSESQQSGDQQSDQQSQDQGEGKDEKDQQKDGDQGDQGQSDEKPQESGDVKLLTTAEPITTGDVFKAIKPDVEWSIAQAVGNMKQQLDGRFGRNEKALTEAVNKHVQAKLDEIQGPAPVIQVTLPDGTKAGDPIPNSRPELPKLIKLAAMRKNVMLIGPAGTGKTTAGEHCAQALGLTFYPYSVGAQTSKTDIAGYQDAHSRLVRSVFRDAFELGGVFLLDEVDAGNANVLTLMNAALSNGYFSFPDSVIKKHADFVCIAAANTFGNGADRQYVGRNQLDAATLDRFIKMEWDYDIELEKRLGKSQPEWLKYIHQLRKARAKTGVRAVFSTRAIVNGVDMLNAGFTRAECETMILWNGISADDKAKLVESL